MHNSYTEEAFLNLTGPGKQVAIKYICWKLEREMEDFRLKVLEMAEKIEENIFSFEQALSAQE